MSCLSVIVPVHNEAAVREILKWAGDLYPTEPEFKAVAKGITRQEADDLAVVPGHSVRADGFKLVVLDQPVIVATDSRERCARL